MDKLLHERLHKVRNPKVVLINDVDYYIWPAEAEAIACEIEQDYMPREEVERDYIPRPRLDGEIISEGDELCQCYDHEPDIVRGIGMIDGEIEVLLDNHGWFNESEIERPQPKVLDADGVEIKVGDTVWNTEGNYKYTVKRMCSSKDCVIADGDKGKGYHLMGYFLTHKEPDSITKIRDDMDASLRGMKVCDLQGFIDRLSAFIERSA